MIKDISLPAPVRQSRLGNGDFRCVAAFAGLKRNFRLGSDRGSSFTGHLWTLKRAPRSDHLPRGSTPGGLVAFVQRPLHRLLERLTAAFFTGGRERRFAAGRLDLSPRLHVKGVDDRLHDKAERGERGRDRSQCVRREPHTAFMQYKCRHPDQAGGHQAPFARNVALGAPNVFARFGLALGQVSPFPSQAGTWARPTGCRNLAVA